MDGVDIQQFISAHRSKLNQEKARLYGDERSPRGIIPSGSQMATRSEHLRQERQAEYRDFLKKREKEPNSIANIRREMARERELEIGSQSTTKDTSIGRQIQDPSSLLSDYSSLKSKRLEEEQRYRGAPYDREREEDMRKPRRQWNEGPPSRQRVRFEESEQNGRSNGKFSRGWEEDEKELMSWARGHGPVSKSRQAARSRTPPEVESPRRSVNRDVHTSVKMRSISAPAIHDSGRGGGIPGLGGGAEDSVAAKRNKQKEYAEILRAQIREREEAKEKERLKVELLDVEDRELQENRPTQKRERMAEKRDLKSTLKERSPPHHSENDSYAPYRPPPSHFDDHSHPYYGPPSGPPYNWGSQYYPYYPPRPPPRSSHDFDYFPPDPYHSPYYHPSYRFPPPSHPRGENPYFPPRHEMRRSPPRRHKWDDDDDDNYMDEYSSKTRKRSFKDEIEALRRNRDLPSHRGKENEEEPFPLSRGEGRRRGTPLDKAAYRAELNRQIREKKESEYKAKIRREMEDTKKEAEVYDPFGKGGCGAPVRDQHGNLVADLKHMRKLNQERLNTSASPSHQPLSDGEQSIDSPRTVFTYDKVDEETKKHSGHMTYRDFLKQQVEEKEKKKEEEKKRQMQEEQKELERLERDRKKLEEDFKRERERERQKEEEAKRKNEQMKREAEEKKREAARKAEEEQRREAERERQLAEAKLSALAEKMAQPLPERRTYSPPIPTLRNKTNEQLGITQPVAQPMLQEQPVFRSSSPPVPAVLKKMAEDKQIPSQVEVEVQQQSMHQAPPSLQLNQSSSHSELPHPPPPKEQGGRELFPSKSIPVHQTAAQATATSDQPSSDILKQLAAMRMHLQSELAKKDGLPGPERATGVFVRTQERKPKPAGPKIARPKDSAMQNALSQFTRLKYTDPARRGDFVSNFPELPDTGSVLELQQDALLRHQEHQLARMKQRNGQSDKPAAVGYPQDRLDNPMASDSINLPIDNRNDLFVDSSASLMPQGHVTVSKATGPGGISLSSRFQPQAKLVGGRRLWGDGRGARLPSAGGQSQFSMTTFDVDSMAVRNDERARRLDAILNAGSNSTNHSQGAHVRLQQHQQDPQTILHDFLRRTERGVSRQSEHSLDCETDFQRISSPHS